LVFLPYEAWLALDAVFRTLGRICLTRRRLLEWTASRDAERQARHDPFTFWSGMWGVPFAMATAALVILQAPELLSSAPLCLFALWFSSPALAWQLSKPVVPARPEVVGPETQALRRLARKTWRYFEHFVNAGENWLPPDNFQDHPAPVVASRTSPTNIGMALLANLSACDLGYLPASALLQRTKATFETMHRMERHRGHFYNWYETRTLRPLPPLYVSSVDSGNLAGHLLVLESGLRELASAPLAPPEMFAGLRDEIQLAVESTKDAGLWEECLALCASPPAGLSETRRRLEALQSCLDAISHKMDPRLREAREWLAILKKHTASRLEELRTEVPWLFLPVVPDFGKADPALASALAQCESSPSWCKLASLRQAFLPHLEEAASQARPDEEQEAWNAFLQAVNNTIDHAVERMEEIERLAAEAREFAEMDFTFLYDKARGLFSIGYNVNDCKCDGSYYDLLASEARLCSYVAVALGQVEQDHWFSLGRLLLSTEGSPVLASWSGSMFEYLMPLLVMPQYRNTLLEETCRLAVARQIEYGNSRGVPWGISECAYNRTDLHQNYQYRAFGVPGLGLKRGLVDDLVIAPYASVLSLMVSPRAAYENLQRLRSEGREGEFGFYEAVDYTPTRLPPGQDSVTVRCFMAHHQGMSLLALDYALAGQPMQRRFLANPTLKAASLLLQERVPKTSANVFPREARLEQSPISEADRETILRVFPTARLAAPEVNLLSNGDYHVMLTTSGSGYSRWKDLAVTRWREDSTRDAWGHFVYLRDLDSGETWSATYQPTTLPARDTEIIFSEGRVEYRQERNDLELYLIAGVSPEDDIELRRITLTNRSGQARRIEFTTYAEVVLAPPSADLAHPAFSNLFVQTEYLEQLQALLCTRRARQKDEQPPYLVHLLVPENGGSGEVSYETSRLHFLGRTRTTANPAALDPGAVLGGSVGAVLDPIVSLRRVMEIGPHETARLDCVLGMAATREEAVGLAEKYSNFRMADRALELAWTHSQLRLRQLNISENEAQRYARFAGKLIYADRALRAPASILASNRRPQSALWGLGLSGDLPLVLVHLHDPSKLDLLRDLLQAHAYWRLKGLAADLVILNQNASTYRQPLQESIMDLVASGTEGFLLDKAGGVFVRMSDQITADDQVLLQTAARAVLSDENGTLEQQLNRPAAREITVLALQPAAPSLAPDSGALPWRESVFHNGLGGFTQDGREYVITLHPGQTTPAPWANVIANPYFGTVVSESGNAYTWVENCHEYRLTPWNNDPVCDSGGEVLYIRDEETGKFWSPSPLPARGTTPYVVRHGFGYTVFEHTEQGIASELWIYVAKDAPVKFFRLKLRNVSGRHRRISAFGCWDWVLGEHRHKALLHVATQMDPKSGALLARNPYNIEFTDRVAFLDAHAPNLTFSGDRREFYGRDGNPASPAALKRVHLSGRTGAGLDPCAAVHSQFDMAAREERILTFKLGVGRDASDVQTLIQRFRRPHASQTALEQVWEYWNRTLDAVQVETPDSSVNILANGWLLYQTLACRMWARTGYYQSGGAFGFRDQLQDAMALVHAEPLALREHLLRAASQQFREGDVQHWWHPPAGRGVRTHFSDDYLWLPYATCRYVGALDDTGILDELVPFLEGRPLRPEEESNYELPGRSGESGSLYNHCVRAIEYGLKFGEHGLPLIGCGDWNDGMNKVGEHGKGESVWLAFFLFDVLMRFAGIAKLRNDTAMVELCLHNAGQIRKNIEAHAWDGAWYRRAYFDSGQPLGSRENAECQIDALPQSWSVLSRAGEPERARQAMRTVDEKLVRAEAGLIQLFDPPFDKSDLEPGYIKGYVPGVRENGGQYTHAALWTVMAFAQMGNTERAWELFRMLNPVGHGDTPEKIATYKVEPYVAAADIYGVAPHTGRGGWTWYTGSAGWMYRLIVETLLGIQVENVRLKLEPKPPKDWDSFKARYRYHETCYHIHIAKEPGLAKPELRLDGQPVTESSIPLLNDGRPHEVELRMAW
jgi:cellobiose phosphorylase